MAFALSLARVGAVLLVASAAGWAASGALFPAGPQHRAERFGWSYALGCGTLVAFVPLSLAVGLRPGWVGFLVVAGLLLAVAQLLRAPLTLPFPPAGGRGEIDRRGGKIDHPLPAGEGRGEGRPTRALLWSLIILGIALYSLRALTEPMWANDFIAIWGLKGKTIFGAVGFPERLTGLAFAHPEYPLGLPLLYAGIAFLTNRWDDHATALVFPLLQVATLAVLVGWLRRRGASPAVAGFAAAIVACFEPLYSGFLTGMADVPLSFGALLFGTALVDALEGSEAGAVRRLVLASALIVATKNEGLFLAVAGSGIAFAAGRAAGRRVVMAILPAALLVRALHIPWRGSLPLADLDVHLWSLERVWDSLLAAGRLLGPSAWLGLGLVGLLIAFGSRNAATDRLLALCGLGLVAYLVVPAFAVRGPDWLVQTTLLRTTSALAPLAAAAIAARCGR